MNKLFLLCSALLLTSVTVFSQNDIRKIDFQNFTYDADYCGGEGTKKITVKAGKFHKETQMDDYVDRRYYEIFGVSYGDIDGDNKEEAVILSMCNTGGTGNFTEAYIYKMESGAPIRIGLLSGGDRAFGGQRKAWIDKGLLIVESNDAGKFGGACCPEYIVTSKYRYSGKKLKQVGKSTSREIYPAKRIAFDRGKFSKTFTVKMTADMQIKRFVVGAGKGQTLTVTKTSSDARVSLKSGEAKVLEDGKGLVAKLSETGDYIFEITNFSDKDIEFKVTVTIK